MSSNFSDFWQKIMTALPKLPSTVSDIFKPETIPHLKNIFPSVSDFELMIFALLVKNFGSLTKTALYVSRGFLEGKTFNLKSFFSISLCIWADNFQDSGKNCRNYHQSCFLPVQTKILPKKYSGKKEFNTCGLSRKQTQIFGGKVSRRIFWGNKFCKKK